MSERRRATITLTRSQIQAVVQQASVEAAFGTTLSKLEDHERLSVAVSHLVEDTTLSRSTLRALLVLAAFDRNDEPRELSEVARQLDLSPSTVHRYISTWIALGLLHQDPVSRRYRRTGRAD
jgi:DNA-binding IclR family transcriptional regulator